MRQKKSGHFQKIHKKVSYGQTASGRWARRAAHAAEQF